MKSMTIHISTVGVASELGRLLCEEIAINKREVSANPQWSYSERSTAFLAMDAESTRISSIGNLYSSKASVKGEKAMPAVYPGYSGKAVDVITLFAGTELVLMEAKFLIRVGGCGPFGGPASFKSRVSGKFNDMIAKMSLDSEIIRQLRIIVVTDEQLPFSIAHIRGLMNAGYPPGSFSSDCNQYNYVLCSSSNLWTIVNGGPVNKLKSEDYLFFTL